MYLPWIPGLCAESKSVGRYRCLPMAVRNSDQATIPKCSASGRAGSSAGGSTPKTSTSRVPGRWLRQFARACNLCNFLESNEQFMTWIGKWRNQYGSALEIIDESDQRIMGKFRTALADSGFFGQEIEVVGLHYGDCIRLSGRWPQAVPGIWWLPIPGCSVKANWKHFGMWL